jgi:hypothetical protein
MKITKAYSRYSYYRKDETFVLFFEEQSGLYFIKRKYYDRKDSQQRLI